MDKPMTLSEEIRARARGYTVDSVNFRWIEAGVIIDWADRAAELEEALDRFPIVHSAAEIRAMGHTGDYSCQRCGGDFDIELYVWLCHSCYEQFLQWQLSQARAEAERSSNE